MLAVPDVELTEEQHAVHNSILNDVYNNKSIITLGGLAGVGKSTIIKKLSESLGGGGCIAAFTGKAASNLRRKGIPASTIHAAIYTPVDDDVNEIRRFELADVSYPWFIIDEASMVPKSIADDLASFRVPIVYVGDHGQLEPIGDKFNIMKEPQYKLETIHRNSGNIVQFASWLRNGGLPDRFFDFHEADGTVHLISEDDDNDPCEPAYIRHECEQIICAYNQTRCQVNLDIRSSIGYDEPIVIGDRVICLQNNRRIGIYNGQQGSCDFFYYHWKKRMNMMTFSDGYDEYCNIPFDIDQFGRASTLKYDPKRKEALFDWAYCITAHKAQGDEWESVFVLEQKCSTWDHKRWAYTAASRAKRSLYWRVA